jgi:hypothetical protein
LGGSSKGFKVTLGDPTQSVSAGKSHRQPLRRRPLSCRSVWDRRATPCQHFIDDSPSTYEIDRGHSWKQWLESQPPGSPRRTLLENTRCGLETLIGSARSSAGGRCIGRTSFETTALGMELGVLPCVFGWGRSVAWRVCYGRGVGHRGRYGHLRPQGISFARDTKRCRAGTASEAQALIGSDQHLDLLFTDIGLGVLLYKFSRSRIGYLSKPDPKQHRELWQPCRRRDAKSTRAEECLGNLCTGPENWKLDARIREIESIRAINPHGCKQNR